MRIKTLGEICNVASGGTPSRAQTAYWNDGTIPWIKIGNIKGKHVDNADEYITQEGLNNSSAKIFPKGTILYTIFATLGEVGILTIEACTNQAIAGIVIKDPSEISTDYLFYYLKSKKEYVNGIGRGVAQNNINMSILRGFEVPIPDISEQHQIVSVLDKVANVIEFRQNQLMELDNLVKSRFVELFGDPICNSKDLILSSLNDVCTKITDGTHDTPPRYDSGYLLLTGKNIRSSGIIFDDVEFVSEEDHKIIYSRCNPEYGDVLYTNIGVNYGTACYNNLNYEFSMKNVALLKPNHRLVNGYYLWECLNIMRNHILSMNQVGGAQTFMGLATIKKITIPVPSIDLQNQFASFVEQTDKSKFIVQQSLDELQCLYDKLMQDYFE